MTHYRAEKGVAKKDHIELSVLVKGMKLKAREKQIGSEHCCLVGA